MSKEIFSTEAEKRGGLTYLLSKRGRNKPSKEKGYAREVERVLERTSFRILRR